MEGMTRDRATLPDPTAPAPQRAVRRARVRRAVAALALLPLVFQADRAAAGFVAGSPSVVVTPRVSDDRAREEWVERTLGGMTPRERAAQMVMPWIPGGMRTTDRAFRDAARLVSDSRVGGFIVGRGDARRTRAALAELQRRSTVPLLISSDLEWGAGMRLTGTTLFPVAMALGATGDTALARRQARATAVEARAYGVHLAFAPVADVNVNAANPIINTRAFGEHPHKVAAFVAAYVHGLQEGGMLAVAKHFPGHGDTRTDSHVELPVVNANRARLDSVELVPFRAAIAADAGAVMTAHIALPRITGTRVPATLSRRIVTGLLREELGFDGLIVTDALNMAGVATHAEAPELVLRAVEAGADVLLQPVGTEVAVDAIVEAMARGRISRSRVDASVRRILLAKTKLGLHERAAPFDTSADARARHAALAREIAGRAVTLVRDRGSQLPIRRGATALVIAYSDHGMTGGTASALVSELNAAGVRTSLVRLGTRSSAAQHRAALSRARRHEGPVILASFTQVAPWRGRIGLPARARATFAAVAAARSPIHLSFGDPYVIGTLPQVPTYLAAWSDAAVMQRAAARAIVGDAAVTGRLPVRLSAEYPAGHGLQRPRSATD